MSTQEKATQTCSTSSKQVPSVITSQLGTPKCCQPQRKPPLQRKCSSPQVTRSSTTNLAVKVVTAAIITLITLSHNNLLNVLFIRPTSAFPLPPPSSLQNWWFSKLNPPLPPPPPEKSSNLDDDDEEEFELIRPRLLRLASRLEASAAESVINYDHHNRPSIDDDHLHTPRINTGGRRLRRPIAHTSHVKNDPSEVNQQQQQFLLTFLTRDQTAYRAELTEVTTDNKNDDSNLPLTTSNPYSENSVLLEDEQLPSGDNHHHHPSSQVNRLSQSGCRHYHGQLVAPSKGYLAVSSCPAAQSSSSSESEELHLSATIMLTTGKVLLIRPLISQAVSPSKEARGSEAPDPDLNSDLNPQLNPESKPPSLKAYAIGRRRFSTRLRPPPPSSKGSNNSSSNCYMAEYEKRHISLEVMGAKEKDNPPSPGGGRKSDNPPPEHQPNSTKLSSPEIAEASSSQVKRPESGRLKSGLLWQRQHSTFAPKSTENSEDEQNTNPLSSSNQLVHQFGRHYLYRVAAGSTGSASKGGTLFPTITLRGQNNQQHQHQQQQNYSSCTERYIDTAAAPLPSTTLPITTPPPPTNNPYSEEADDEDYPAAENSHSTEPPKDYEEEDENEEPLEIKSPLASQHRRAKRELTKDDVYSKTFTIETVIFVDRPLLERFNGNRQALQKLILAIMSEVQLIFNFDSLRIRVRILIRAIRFLESGKEAPATAEGDIDQYLDNFCAWQRRLWMGANRTARWDHALMLTGLDLYKRVAGGQGGGSGGWKKNRKVLGLAWVNGMCRPAYSCTLNEGKNFEAAYVIAHEMAHSLGMLHDGYDNNCDPEKYIMSEKTGPGKINWSPCSNLYLENFLTKSNMRCLESTRADRGGGGGKRPAFLDPFDAATDTRLPGEQYSLNEQCELALGAGYRAYTSAKAPFQDVCRELWCSSGTWATPAHPALEGSACSRRKSCYQGGCVDKQRAFAQSKIKMFDNRRPTDSPPPSRLSVSGGGGSGGSGSSAASNGSGGASGSFMRRVQRFLRSTIRSVVGFFG